MLYVLNCLVPVFLLIGLGWLLRRIDFLPPAFFVGLNKLVYWVALPTFLFAKISTTKLGGAQSMRIFWVMLLVTLLTLLLADLSARFMSCGIKSRGVMAMGAFRGNLAFVGWPIIAYAFAHLPQKELDEIMAFSILAAAPLIPIYNVLSVIVLLPASQEEGRKLTFKSILQPLITNPLILACVSAAPFCYYQVKFPLFLDRTFASLSDLSLPLALIGMGASPAIDALKSGTGLAMIPACLRIIAGPLLALSIGRMLGLEAIELQVAVLLMACPTAVASYVLADQMRADSNLAGATVVLSTLLSIPALGSILYIFAPR